SIATRPSSDAEVLEGPDHLLIARHLEQQRAVRPGVAVPHDDVAAGQRLQGRHLGQPHARQLVLADAPDGLALLVYEAEFANVLKQTEEAFLRGASTRRGRCRRRSLDVAVLMWLRFDATRQVPQA